MWLVTHIAVLIMICANNNCGAKHLNQRNVTIWNVILFMAC